MQCHACFKSDSATHLISSGFGHESSIKQISNFFGLCAFVVVGILAIVKKIE